MTRISLAHKRHFPLLFETPSAESPFATISPVHFFRCLQSYTLNLMTGTTPSPLAEAIIASGLVKNGKPPPPVLPQPAASPADAADRKETRKRIQGRDRARSQLKGSVEEVILDRMTTTPLPRLLPERPHPPESPAGSLASGASPSSVSDISFLYSQPRKEPKELSNEEILASLHKDEPITFPRIVFGAQTIGKPQIASRANYEQLANLLHTLTAPVETNLDATAEERLTRQRDAYDTILSEIVRQGYFECSAKGELFQAVRTYVTDAVDQIPVLQKKLKWQGDVAEKQISELIAQTEELSAQNEKSEKARMTLERVCEEAQSRIEFLEMKIPALEEEARNKRVQVVGFEGKLQKKEDEIAELLKERTRLSTELARQLQIVDDVANELRAANAALAEKTTVVGSLSEEIEQLKRQCESLREEVEHLRDAAVSPIAIDRVDVQTQTKTYAKSIRQRPALAAPDEPAMSVVDFQALKSGYDACGDATEGLSYAQFERLKKSILAQFTPNSTNGYEVIAVQTGEFQLADCRKDDIRMFAHSLMSRIMDRACRSVARREAGTQSVVVERAKVSRETNVQPTDFPKAGFGDAFTKLLDPHYADRPPRTFEWILKSLRSIFDEKTVKDATDSKEGRECVPMPQYTLQWSTRQYGLSYLSHQCCWDLVNSARAHQSKSLEIELFRRFLDGDYTTNQLTFFLRVRANCLRRGLTLSTRVTDCDAFFNEVFLPSSTALEFVRKLFDKAGQDLIDITIRQMRDEFVRRPSPTVDPSLSYIRMSVFCHQCVDAFGKYELFVLRQMLQFVQIAPKLDGKQFGQLVRGLAPSLTDQAVGELFRTMNATSANKVLMKKGKFKREFRARSLLSPESAAAFDAIGSPSPELERARAKWAQLQPRLDEVLETMHKTENPALAHALQCLRIEMDQVSASLTCYDVIGVHSHILSAIISWQSLQWAKAESDPEVMDQLITAIRGILQI
jgi:hypothetical protein